MGSRSRCGWPASDLAQLNCFDLVVTLLLANVVQNAIIGPDTSRTGGLLAWWC